MKRELKKIRRELQKEDKKERRVPNSDAQLFVLWVTSIQVKLWFLINLEKLVFKLVKLVVLLNKLVLHSSHQSISKVMLIRSRITFQLISDFQDFLLLILQVMSLSQILDLEVLPFVISQFLLSILYITWSHKLVNQWSFWDKRNVLSLSLLTKLIEFMNGNLRNITVFKLHLKIKVNHKWLNLNLVLVRPSFNSLKKDLMLVSIGTTKM